MDNPATESTSNAPLDTNSAAEVFAAMLDPEPTKEEAAENGEANNAEPEAEAQAETQEPEAQAEEASDDDPTVTVKIDGQDVEVKLSELKNGYQRQADYTRKTMEVAEQRKAAEAETTKAREERAQYANALQQQAALLNAQLQDQQNIDWQALIESDPVEYLKQQHLAQTRQAQLQQTLAEQHRVEELQQAELNQHRQAFVRQQQEELLAKLPEWKDEARAKADKAALREFLTGNGFTDEEIGNIADHRAVLMARKAMLYDQMLSKASAAAKKVEKLPQKVERPGGGESQTIDKRSAAYQRLGKTGRVEDAASVFASIL